MAVSPTQRKRKGDETPAQRNRRTLSPRGAEARGTRPTRSAASGHSRWHEPCEHSWMTSTIEPGKGQTVARAVRRSRDLRQADVGAAAGLDRSVVSRVETGVQIPTASQRAKLAAALGLEPARLLERV